MTYRLTTFVAFLLAAAIAQAQTRPATTQPAAERLVEVAPRLSSTDETTRSLDVALVIRLDYLRINLRALYEAPDRYAMYVTDGHDHTPIVVVAGGKLLAYDPAAAEVSLADEGSGTLAFDFKETVNLNFNFSNKPGASSVLADVRSLVAARKGLPDVRELGPGRFELTMRSPSGNGAFATVDLAREQPYTRLALDWVGDDDEFTFTRLARNEPIDPRLFDMPTRADLEKRFPVRDGSRAPAGEPKKGLTGAIYDMRQLARVFTVRLAQRNPKMREAAQRNWVTRIDWDAVAASDATIAPALRELFPGAAPPDVEPVAAATQPATVPTR